MYSFVDHNQRTFFLVHPVGATYVFCQEIYILCCNFEFPSVLTDVFRVITTKGFLFVLPVSVCAAQRIKLRDITVYIKFR